MIGLSSKLVESVARKCSPQAFKLGGAAQIMAIKQAGEYISAALTTLRDEGPTPAMIVAAIRTTDTAPSSADDRLAMEAMNLLPAVTLDYAPAGLTACSELARDWREMLSALIAEVSQ